MQQLESANLLWWKLQNKYTIDMPLEGVFLLYTGLCGFY